MIKSVIKYKLLIGALSIVLILAMGIVGYYYLNSMSVQNSSLNISKIEARDKFYAYDIYNDFYYHIEKYDDTGELVAEFSELIPTKTSIGYDFSTEKPKVVMQGYLTGKSQKLITNNGNYLSDEIENIRGFAQEFNKIFATQDSYYLDSVTKKVEEYLFSLYGQKVSFDVNEIDKYYEDAIPLPISNLVVRPHKLNNIRANLKAFEYCKDKWCPNIVEWKFGESDKIYLQYITQFHNKNIEDYLKERKKNNRIIIKTVKVNNNKIQKFFFEINNRNQIEALFMDENGYIYLLKYSAQNPVSYRKYLPDFLKIAYGVYFIDVKNFSNGFAKKQQHIEEAFKIHQSDEHRMLDDKLTKHGLIKHFGLQNSYIRETIFDKKMEKYKQKYGSYPLLEQVNKEILTKKLLSEGWDELNPRFFGKNPLKDSCKTIECVERLRDNNWTLSQD